MEVTSEMNDKLLMPFTALEVKEALFQMFPTKAPGLDGFPTHFFQTSLGFVWTSGDLSSAVGPTRGCRPKGDQ